MREPWRDRIDVLTRLRKQGFLQIDEGTDQRADFITQIKA
ncbi:hypothetical protein GALL_396360 [mine drainage metagenome]|uniref:Uncharacterized protein n=1 Tax=mine drainage metagenome TaxID=410659 RepID=A0A1J5QF80_9ZZZZ